MLKSFINYKTGEKVRLSKGEHDREKLENELGMEIKGEIPFANAKDLSTKKEKKDGVSTVSEKSGS